MPAQGAAPACVQTSATWRAIEVRAATATERCASLLGGRSHSTEKCWPRRASICADSRVTPACSAAGRWVGRRGAPQIRGHQ